MTIQACTKDIKNSILVRKKHQKANVSEQLKKKKYQTTKVLRNEDLIFRKRNSYEFQNCFYTDKSDELWYTCHVVSS